MLNYAESLIDFDLGDICKICQKDDQLFATHSFNNSILGHMYNFFASHSQWKINQVKKLVGIDATFVTILRDPVEVFESGYVYFGMEKILERDINQYIKTVRRHPRSKMAIFGKNQLLYDLGK